MQTEEQQQSADEAFELEMEMALAERLAKQVEGQQALEQGF
jgi:hypothetical protein